MTQGNSSKISSSQRIIVTSTEELHQKLNEGLKSIDEGKTYSVEEVAAYLNQRFEI